MKVNHVNGECESLSIKCQKRKVQKTIIKLYRSYFIGIYGNHWDLWATWFILSPPACVWNPVGTCFMSHNGSLTAPMKDRGLSACRNGIHYIAVKFHIASHYLPRYSILLLWIFVKHSQTERDEHETILQFAPWAQQVKPYCSKKRRISCM